MTSSSKWNQFVFHQQKFYPRIFGNVALSPVMKLLSIFPSPLIKTASTGIISWFLTKILSPTLISESKIFCCCPPKSTLDLPQLDKKICNLYHTKVQNKFSLENFTQ